jgi:hypothetical protein
MTDEKKFSVKVLKEFFGLREGDKLADFAQELKALSDEEKQQLHDGIEDGSLTY